MNRFYSLIIILLSLAACHSGDKKNNYPKIQVQEPVYTTAPLMKHYIGITKTVQQVTIRARVEGFLEKRLFKEGSFVKKDEQLFTIERAPFEAQLLSAKGNLEKAKADLTFQEVQFKRYKELVVHQNIAKAQYDQQYAQYLSALGQLDAAQGSYDQAVLNLGYTSVISPMNGMVGKALVDVGNLVSGSNKTELVKIVQLDPLRVEFNPAISDMKEFIKYQKNQPFQAKVYVQKYGKQSWNGVVDFYNNDGDENTSTLLLRTTIINKDYLLRPDIFVKVDVVLDPKHPARLVPLNQVVDVQGLKQIQVVDKDHKLTWREIKLADVKNDLVQVESGLKNGDLVVLKNDLNQPEDGMVEPVIVPNKTKIS